MNLDHTPLQKNVLIIGYGSIGKKHHVALDHLGCNVSIHSKHLGNFSSIQHAIDKTSPDYIVVSSKTSDHEDDFLSIVNHGFSGPLLIEKPLFAHPSSKAVDRPKTFVGYNLRYLKEMEHLSHELQNETLLSAWIYAGQDLKKWRPNQCSKESYSAYHNQGGGVLRDLSHELDLIRFLFGKPHKVKCIGGKFSNVTVDSEDTYTCLFSTPRCPAIGLQLNYIDHTGQRFMIINTTEHTFTVDLISHTLKKNSSSNPMIFHDDIFSSYIYMHHEILTQKFPKACNMKQALDTVELIKVIEETNEQN